MIAPCEKPNSAVRGQSIAKRSCSARTVAMKRGSAAATRAGRFCSSMPWIENHCLRRHRARRRTRRAHRRTAPPPAGTPAPGASPAPPCARRSRPRRGRAAAADRVRPARAGGPARSSSWAGVPSCAPPQSAALHCPCSSWKPSSSPPASSPRRNGDKTQLLALLLAAKFRRPCPSCWASSWPRWSTTRWPARWAKGRARPVRRAALGDRAVLPRDGRVDAGARQHRRRGRRRHAALGVFGTTVLAFFLAEMGDKTQIATVALARYSDLVAVVAGTTLGMMIANVPGRAARRRGGQEGAHASVHGIAAAIRGAGRADAAERREAVLSFRRRPFGGR